MLTWLFIQVDQLLVARLVLLARNTHVSGRCCKSGRRPGQYQDVGGALRRFQILHRGAGLERARQEAGTQPKRSDNGQDVDRADACLRIVLMRVACDERAVDLHAHLCREGGRHHDVEVAGGNVPLPRRRHVHGCSRRRKGLVHVGAMYWDADRLGSDVCRGSEDVAHSCSASRRDVFSRRAPCCGICQESGEEGHLPNDEEDELGALQPVLGRVLLRASNPGALYGSREQPKTSDGLGEIQGAERDVDLPSVCHPCPSEELHRKVAHVI
mmetsp:Transcript_114804/g.319767  ORF Transcript_114804/g.319767 Transcript_114804/m.319767 type:complete len:270 (+) Transcript_114804:80-889(+)